MAAPEHTEKFLLGQKMAVEFLGNDLVDDLRKKDKANIFTKTLMEYTLENTLSSYARPGLTFRERNLINIAIFIALNREDELRINLLSAQHNGLSKDEICETLRHAMLYTGMAAGRDALLLASEILGD
ncbi:hypothetical protein AYO21_08411 [Fonsecaea monophora]|uniref:Carboxymuconolactone decarboxylase-like domain-containing protein n=1 Tax=Fonsecaea monophora TaxID=254056 RepID=A0A177EZ26_9EURO|nr:hypothetical protein AYO21_08411 [Fonsecaea monophora]OAG37334.1 hypothetical protein AYO21_08411 [Fonsecaea monophora]